MSVCVVVGRNNMGAWHKSSSTFRGCWRVFLGALDRVLEPGSEARPSEVAPISRTHLFRSPGDNVR